MNVNSSCPCCSGSMLLHLSSRRSYWLCSHCRIEITNSDAQKITRKQPRIEFNSSLMQAVLGSSTKSVGSIAVV